MKHFKKLTKRESNYPQIYKRVEDDDSYSTTCTEHDPVFIEWVAAGNTPLDAD